MLLGALAADLREEKPPRLRGALVLTLTAALAFLGLQAFETSSLASKAAARQRFTSDEAVWKTAAFRAEHPRRPLRRDFRLASLRGPRTASRGPRRPARERADVTTSLSLAGALESTRSTPTSSSANAHLFFGLFYLVVFVHARTSSPGIAVWGWLFARTFRPRHCGLATALDGVAVLELRHLDARRLFPLFYLTGDP